MCVGVLCCDLVLAIDFGSGAQRFQSIVGEGVRVAGQFTTSQPASRGERLPALGELGDFLQFVPMASSQLNNTIHIQGKATPT